jgi:hypothetical protein
MFGEMEAIDSLLQQLAYYKRHDPTQVEVGWTLKSLYFYRVMDPDSVTLWIWIRISVGISVPGTRK